MNKTELIDAIAAEAGLTKADAKKAVEAFFSNVEKSLKQGKKVAIVGFGSWSVAKKEARDARNPRTGAVSSKIQSWDWTFWISKQKVIALKSPFLIKKGTFFIY